MTEIRISDVAKAAGVSKATVSLALNGAPGRVSASTQEKIRRVAREIGYVPNPLARGLRTQSTHTIGLVAERVATTPFAGRMISGAQAVARAHGHLVILIDTDGRREDEEQAIETLSHHRVDGLIYAKMFHQVIEAPQNLPSSAVLMNCRSAAGPWAAVVPDDDAGGRAAARELVAAGHRRIAYIRSTTVPIPVASAIRQHAYLDVLAEAGIAADAELQVGAENNARGGREAMAKLWRLPPSRRPTAVFAFNDQVAMGVYAFAAQNDIDIPRELAVVGFDDHDLIAPELEPALTTVSLPHEAMGRWAMEVALGVRASPSDGSAHLMPCPLVRRDSVSAQSPPAGGLPASLGT